MNLSRGRMLLWRRDDKTAFLQFNFPYLPYTHFSVCSPSRHFPLFFLLFRFLEEYCKYSRWRSNIRRRRGTEVKRILSPFPLKISSPEWRSIYFIEGKIKWSCALEVALCHVEYGVLGRADRSAGDRRIQEIWNTHTYTRIHQQWYFAW